MTIRPIHGKREGNGRAPWSVSQGLSYLTDSVSVLRIWIPHQPDEGEGSGARLSGVTSSSVSRAPMTLLCESRIAETVKQSHFPLRPLKWKKSVAL